MNLLTSLYPHGYRKDGLMKQKIDDIAEKIEEIMEWGGTGKDITLLVISAVALLISIFHLIPGLPFDAADIALVDDEIKELPHLFALSGKMMNKIKFNLSFSMLLNFVAIILAMTGILNPVVGALVHNCGSVFVIINSAFLTSYTYRNI